jgi:hypothetical protein
MKKRSLLLIFWLFVLVACGPAVAPETAVPNATSPARPTPTSDPSLLNNNNNTSDGQADMVGYPPPPPTPAPVSYPDAAAPTPLPAPADAYPAADQAGTVWVMHAQGQQCVDASTFKYPTAQDARAGLVAAGITVYNLETVSMMVCQACNCPTSIHYRAQIAADDLEKAVALGWSEE